MTRIIISIVLMVAFLLYVGHVSIGIKPFSFLLPYWHRSVGLLLIIVGFFFFNIGEHSKGYADGLKKGADQTLEILDTILKTKNK